MPFGVAFYTSGHDLPGIDDVERGSDTFGGFCAERPWPGYKPCQEKPCQGLVVETPNELGLLFPGCRSLPCKCPGQGLGVVADAGKLRVREAGLQGFGVLKREGREPTARHWGLCWFRSGRTGRPHCRRCRRDLSRRRCWCWRGCRRRRCRRCRCCRRGRCRVGAGCQGRQGYQKSDGCCEEQFEHWGLPFFLSRGSGFAFHSNCHLSHSSPRGCQQTCSSRCHGSDDKGSDAHSYTEDYQLGPYRRFGVEGNLCYWYGLSAVRLVSGLEGSGTRPSTTLAPVPAAARHPGGPWCGASRFLLTQGFPGASAGSVRRRTLLCSVRLRPFLWST